MTIQGKRITKYAETKEAAEKLRQELLPIDRAFITEPPKAVAQAVPGRLTVSSFLPKYLAATTWKPSTLQATRRLLTTHVLPKLGNTALVDIKPVDVATLLATMNDSGLAQNSIRTVHSKFRGMLQTAFEWEYNGPRNSDIK